jgi:hypothetical protein
MVLRRRVPRRGDAGNPTRDLRLRTERQHLGLLGSDSIADHYAADSRAASSLARHCPRGEHRRVRIRSAAVPLEDAHVPQSVGMRRRGCPWRDRLRDLEGATRTSPMAMSRWPRPGSGAVAADNRSRLSTSRRLAGSGVTPSPQRRSPGGPSPPELAATRCIADEAGLCDEAAADPYAWLTFSACAEPSIDNGTRRRSRRAVSAGGGVDVS